MSAWDYFFKGKDLKLAIDYLFNFLKKKSGGYYLKLSRLTDVVAVQAMLH